MNKKIIFSLAFLLLLPVLISTPLLAHSGGEIIDDYNYRLTTTPEHPNQDEITIIDLEIHDKEDNPVTGLNPTLTILREELTPSSVSSGVYTFNYTFDIFGPIETIITIGEATAKEEIYVNPPSTELNTSLLTTLGIIFLSITILCVYLTVNKKIELSTLILVLSLVLILSVVVYGFDYYKNSQYNEGCFFNLPDGTKTYHCHQYFYLEVCGEAKEFPREEGDLARGHTHDDGHKIHWHPYQPVLDPFEDMTLENFFSDLNLEFSETKVQDPKTKEVYENNACNDGNENRIRVYETLQNSTVETEIEEFIGYGLQDEAKYRIIYS